MEFIKKSSEDEMIAVFLNAEINSVRFGDGLVEIIKKLNLQNSIITEPNLFDDKENKIRKNIIANYRGYGANRDLFEGFPNVHNWEWVYLSIEDLEQIKYIDYDYWVDLSSGTRLAKDAAKNILNGVEIFEQKNDNFIEASKTLLSGSKFPPMILVSNLEKEYFLVLEGHLRLTAYMLEPSVIPQKLKAIVGYASNVDLKKWGLY